MCWRFVSGNCLCRYGMHMLIDASAQLPHIRQLLPTHKTQLLTSSKSHVLSSSPFLNLARPLQPIRHVKLNHCAVLISLWEQQPRCCRGERSASGALHEPPDCHAACPLDGFYHEWGILCFHVVHFFVLMKGSQQAGIKSVYRVGRHSGRHSICELVSKTGRFQAACSIITQSTSQQPSNKFVNTGSQMS